MARSLHLVREELQGFAEAFPRFDAVSELIPALRQGSAQLSLPKCDDETIEWGELFIDRPADPALRLVLYRPRTVTFPVPVILHIHGGGFIAGRPEIAHESNAALCRDLGVAIVSVNYRLAPEAPFPAALDDCHATLKWIHEHAAGHGFDPDRVAVKGESAGGGLAASLAQLARDRGEYPIAFQCLTYPMLDDRTASDPHAYAGEFIWTGDHNRFAWGCYLGNREGSDAVPHYAAAARCENCEGLPPTAILTGPLDLFFEENLEFVRRLGRAGVPVEVIAYSGVVHGFERAGETAIKARYQSDVRAALRAALFRTSEGAGDPGLQPPG